MMQLESFVILLNVALYATCYFAQVPVLPYLMKQLGADAAAYGVLQTVFSIIQTSGGLLSGPFVDAYGGKALLLASFAASALSYAMTAASSNMYLLYASRVPTLLQHAVLAARAMISELSSERDRATLLGYVGLAYGVGVVVGPALGGQVSRVSVYAPSWMAAAGSLVSCVMISQLLPGGRAKERQVDSKSKDDGDIRQASPGRERKPLRVADLLAVLATDGVPDLLVIKFLFGLAFGLFQSTFPIFLQDVFGLDAAQNGNVMSYVGLLGMGVQGVVISWLTHRCSESLIVRFSCWGLLVSLAALAFANTLWQLLLILAPLTLFGLLIGTINTSQLTKAVDRERIGSVVAVDMSIGSGCRALTPVLGTWLLKRFGFSSIGMSAASCLAVAIVLIELGVVQCVGPKGASKTD